MVDQEKSVYGFDRKGNEVFMGEDIYIHGEEFWLVKDLSQGEIEVLEFFGAKKIKARFGL